MSETRSDTEPPEGSEPEPVDAEFEPVPESPSERAKVARAPTKGTGPLKLALFVTSAALIGGFAGYGTAYVLGVTGLAPGSSARVELDPALEARLAALESDTTGDGLDALGARLDRLENQAEGEALRREAFAQLVRDVADLRQAVSMSDTLEDPTPGQISDGALAALEQRLDSAVGRLEQQILTVNGATQTAQETADQVRSALAAAMTSLPTGETGSNPGIDGARIEALEQAFARLQDTQTRLNAQIADLAALSPQVSALEEAAIAQSDLDQLARRITAVRRSVTALEEAASAAQTTRADVSDRATRALTFASLSEAALRSDEPFAVELAALTRAWPDAPRVDRLLPLARNGAPSLDSLLDNFPGEALRTATGAAQTYLGIVRIQRDGAEGPAAQIEAHLAAGELQSALEIVRALDGEPAQVLADWRVGAEARRTIEVALMAMGRALRTQGDAP